MIFISLPYYTEPENMNISLQNFFINNTNSRTANFCTKSRMPLFRGQNHSAYDTFEKSTVKSMQQNNKEDLKGKFLKHTILTDDYGQQKHASIYQNKKMPNEFSIYLDDDFKQHENPLCTMEISDYGDCIYIDYISRKNKNCSIKGAGSELIKFAAQSSISKGYGGKIKLLAVASLPFYYKNNFRTEKAVFSSEKNAYLSYISRNKSDILYSWPPTWSNLDLELTQAAGHALVQNKKLHTEELTETEYDRILTYSDDFGEHKVNIDIDLCETTNNFSQNKVAKEYVIQIIQKSDEDILPIGVLKMQLDEDNNDKKYLSIRNIYINNHPPAPNCIDSYNKIKDLLLKTARSKMEKLGAHYIKYQAE